MPTKCNVIRSEALSYLSLDVSDLTVMLGQNNHRKWNAPSLWLWEEHPNRRFRGESVIASESGSIIAYISPKGCSLTEQGAISALADEMQVTDTSVRSPAVPNGSLIGCALALKRTAVIGQLSPITLLARTGSKLACKSCTDLDVHERTVVACVLRIKRSNK